MEHRVKNSYSTYLYQFAHDVLVCCPQCEGKAVVDTGNFLEMKISTDRAKVVCPACGYNKTLENILHRDDPKQKRGKILKFGAPIDPFFHLPLWLQADFSGNTLWAYNLEHLDFLAAHVGAKLRERNGQKTLGRSIGARLPRWMTAADNREAVLKALEKLRVK